MAKSMALRLPKHMVVVVVVVVVKVGGGGISQLLEYSVDRVRTLAFIHVEMNVLRNARGADGSIMLWSSKGVRKVITSYNHNLSLGKPFLRTNGQHLLLSVTKLGSDLQLEYRQSIIFKSSSDIHTIWTGSGKSTLLYISSNRENMFCTVNIVLTCSCVRPSQMLHHTDSVAPPDHERSPSWSSRHGENRNHQGPGQSAGHHGVRLQLLRADGLQGERLPCVTPTAPSKSTGTVTHAFSAFCFISICSFFWIEY